MGLGLGAFSELKCPCLELAMVVWAEAGIDFDRVVESLRSIWGDYTERRGLPPTECFNLIPLSV